MKERPNYNSFQELLKNNSHTENFDAVVPADPVPPPDNNPPRIPQWGHSLTGRVDKLEKNVTAINQNMTAMGQSIDKRLAAIEKHITGK